MRNARRGKHVARRSSMLTLSNVRRVLSIEISTDLSFIEFFASIHWSLHRVSLISSLNSPLTRWANSLRVTHKSPSHAYRERSKAAATCWMVFIEILANYSVCSHQWHALVESRGLSVCGAFRCFCFDCNLRCWKFAFWNWQRQKFRRT